MPTPQKKRSNTMEILLLLVSMFRWILVAMVLLLIIGYTYEQISRYLAEKKYPPSGELADVGGHQLHYLKKGVAGPSVVFESGVDLGGHLPWFRVQNEIAKDAVTVSYDRAGILWSQRGDNPKSCKAMAAEWHTMLSHTGIEKPYILVGHSLAGLIIRSFVYQYPEDVSGVVLVDVSHPEQVNRLSKDFNALMKLPPKWVLTFLNSIGIGRIFNKIKYDNTDKGDDINIHVRELFFKSMSAAREEIDNLKDLCREVAPITSFDNIPVLVITGTEPNRYDQLPNEGFKKEMTKVWEDLQQDLLTLSTDSKRILAPKSGHYVQLDEPDVVIGAIKKMIAKTHRSKDKKRL